MRAGEDMDVRIQPDRLAETFAALVAIDSPSYGERQMADELTRRKVGGTGKRRRTPAR